MHIRSLILLGEGSIFLFGGIHVSVTFQKRRGKLIAYLYDSSGVPLELKKVIEKATAANPEDRFDSVQSLRDTINKVTAVRRTTVTALVAIAIAVAIFVAVVRVHRIAACGDSQHSQKYKESFHNAVFYNLQY